MAKEKNLTAVTSVAAADFARVVTSAGASVKATFANIAKYIVETYNGSTVAGSAQSVKSALDSLNSKCGYVSLSTNILTYAESLPAGADIVAYFNGTDYTWLPNQDPNYRYGLFHIMKGNTVCLVDAYSWNGALHKYNFYGNNSWQGWR